MLAGLVYSILLWRQQVLSLRQSRQDQIELLSSAAKTAQKHAEEQAKKLASQVDERITSVNREITSVSALVKSSQSTLKDSISQIKPAPVKYASLQFSFHTDRLSEFPALKRTVSRDSDGSVTVSFEVKNTSEDVPTGKGDLWIQICGSCKYGREAKGLAREAGSKEHVRHMVFENLNPGVFLEMPAINVIPPPVGKPIQISFAYACERCKSGDAWSQSVFMTIPRIQAAPETH